MIKKTLQPTNDLYIQFTEEELSELDIKSGNKFDVKHQGDGSIKLTKYVKMEIDMEEWPREILELIIKDSCEQDISVNEVICNLLKQSIDTVSIPSNTLVDDFTKGRQLLTETYHKTDAFGTDYDFPTSYNSPFKCTTPEDILPEQ